MLMSDELRRREAKQECPLDVARAGHVDRSLELIDALYDDNLATWYLLVAIDTGHNDVLTRLLEHPHRRRYKNPVLVTRLLALLPPDWQRALTEVLLA
jgi:hypothetical protein